MRRRPERTTEYPRPIVPRSCPKAVVQILPQLRPRVDISLYIHAGVLRAAIGQECMRKIPLEDLEERCEKLGLETRNAHEAAVFALVCAIERCISAEHRLARKPQRRVGILRVRKGEGRHIPGAGNLREVRAAPGMQVYANHVRRDDLPLPAPFTLNQCKQDARRTELSTACKVGEDVEREGGRAIRQLRHEL